MSPLNKLKLLVGMEFKSSKRCNEMAYREQLIKKIDNHIELTEHDIVYIQELLTTSSLRRVQSSNYRGKESQLTQTEEDQNIGLTDESEVLDFLKKQALRGSDSRSQKVSLDIWDCMNYLFRSRRHFIVHTAPTVQELLRNYPILFETQQLADELGRITGVDGKKNFKNNLVKLCPKIMKILQCVEDPWKISCLIKKKLKELENSESAVDEEYKYVEMLGTLLYLPTLFKEDVMEMICFNTDETEKTLPVIITSSSLPEAIQKNALFYIYAENVKIFESRNFVEVFFFYVATFFIFDMSFLQSCIQTFTFIETYLLHVNPGQDIIRVKEAIKMLGSL